MEIYRFSVAAHATAANMQQAFRRALQNVEEMDPAHVPLLAGTDFPNPFMLPGFGLHDELELLVQAGLTPKHALRTATTAPLR
jgi:imidazolonepropionase-like amidohydrolase